MPAVTRNHLLPSQRHYIYNRREVSCHQLPVRRNEQREDEAASWRSGDAGGGGAGGSGGAVHRGDCLQLHGGRVYHKLPGRTGESVTSAQEYGK